ncbi:hypothetical protein B0H15DRAFT_815847 [Mycena belliarum]|uniref:Uncharacterized protein n=1 Tax=Mycena belliarum TaxID=1033014 RepID=A0AAD6UG46_9AGAR|nr:hypothetical protein B0H15DRAFT_815847 [Mycena belliae]
MSLHGLPNSLLMSPHLIAHKYIFVCSLTVAAWDTLVLSRRTLRLMRTGEWSILKVLSYFLRALMPIEFALVAIGVFDTKLSQSSCQNFFLFEPICTAVLLAAASAVHVIRIYAIYDHSLAVLIGMGSLFVVQVVVTAICCAFYQRVPLLDGQGCMAGPTSNWVGIYWLAPTLLYTASAVLAVMRSVNSLQKKKLSAWNLIIRDSLNLYGVILMVNMVNMLLGFIVKPENDADPIKTIAASMTAVLTTTHTLRIVLSIRGSLRHGGLFLPPGWADPTKGPRATHILAARPGLPSVTLDITRGKQESGWATDNDKDSESRIAREPEVGVKITVDQEIGYDE